MAPDLAYESEAARVLDERIAQLRSLTLDQAAVLPEASGEEVVFGNTRCSVTVFRQDNPHNLPNAVLVTVQVSRSGFLGLARYHTERGLVFSSAKPVRDATDIELRNSGG